MTLSTIKTVELLIYHWSITWAVVVAELVERSHPAPEIRGSNPIIGKVLSTNCN